MGMKITNRSRALKGGWKSLKSKYVTLNYWDEDIVYSLINIEKSRVKKDIYAFAEKYEDNGAARVRLVIRSVDNSADTGCRFRYIKPVINFEYDELVKALNEAIDKEAQVTDASLFTNEREASVVSTTFDYDALMAEFGDVVGGLMNENPNYYGPRITQIVDKYLGKGKKVSDATIDQAEFISLIVNEIKEELVNK